MGFYGNITNVNNTTFVFDRIYPSRSSMDQNASMDGIFIGRYVLIEYDNNENTFFNEVYIKNERFYFSTDTAKKTEIKYQDTENENYYVTTGTVVYTEVDGKYTYYKCIGSKEDNIADFQQILDVDVTNSYFINYTVDKSVYPNLGRGYDSTVWQKTYVNSEEKYVMIAELNSVVPTFDLTIDAPTMNPSPPHFDADSTNVYYKMHVQPQWGFKVAHAIPEKKMPGEDNEFASVAMRRPSDEKAIYKYYTYNKNQNYDESQSMEYDAAIYYNKAGFNKETRSKVEINNDFKDAIMIEPTGYSGQKYNAHNIANPNQKTYKKDIQELSIILPSLGNTINDIWDLAYGEWDYQRDENNEIIKDVYGKELTTFKDKRNLNIDWGNTSGLRLVKREKEGNGFEFDPRQSQTIAGCINSVNDLMGMIITNSLIPEEKFVKDENETEEEYKARLNELIQEVLNKAVTNHIYYGNYDINNPLYKGYYIKYPDDKLIEYKEVFDENGNSNYTDLPEDFSSVRLTSFEKQEYYYIDNQNYYLEQTSKVNDGINYYLKNDVENIFETKILAGELDENTGKNISFTEYKPNTYYELDKNYNYIYTTEEKPIDSKTYYSIGEKELQAITSGGVEEGNLPTLNQSILFNPFNHYSDVQTNDPYDENVNWTGYFYKGAYDEVLDDDLYVKVKKGDDFNDSLNYYFAKNYKIDKTYDIYGNPVIIYDFSDENDKHGKLVPIKFKYFKPPIISKDENNNIIEIEGSKYYIQKENPETKLIEYELFIPSEEDKNEDGSYKIPSDIIYYEITPQSIATPKVPFYWPGLYYYKENWGDYIKAEENSPIHEEYFIIKKDAILNPVENIFYRPGKFFYENESGYYILDYSEIMDSEKYYYTAPFYYVKEDPTGMFPTGSIWNTSIKDLPRDEETGKSLVILATKVEGWKWKELIGFARDFNTIHGLMIEINKILKTGDDKTRDLATVQGCINSINDIIVKIGKLTPGHLMIVDEYGRIRSSEYTTKQNFSYTNFGTGYENGIVEDKENCWLNIDIKDNYKDPLVTLQHTFNEVGDTTTYSDKNGNGIKEDQTVRGLNDSYDDTLQLYTPIVDATGHVIGKNTETVTLPYGFKTIKSGNASELTNDIELNQESIVADNTKDALIIAAGNKWIHTASNNEKKTFTIAHEIHTINTDNDVTTDINDLINNEVNDIINIPDWSYDEAGHITSKQNHEYTLPFGFKTISTNGRGESIEGLENIGEAPAAASIVADNTQDTLHINSGDSWIRITADSDNDILTISHDKHIMKTDENTTDWSQTESDTAIPTHKYEFDSAGHVIEDKIEHYRLPFGYGKIKDDGDSFTAATATYDELTFASDNWLTATVTKDTVTYSHSKPQEVFGTPVGQTLDKAIAFGDNFNVLQVGVDEKGHVASLDAKKITLPSFSITNENNEQIITGITILNNGQVNIASENVANFVLIDHNDDNINHVQSKDTISSAFTKIDDRIDVNINNIKNLTDLVGKESVASQIKNALYIEGNEKYALTTKVNEDLEDLKNNFIPDQIKSYLYDEFGNSIFAKSVDFTDLKNDISTFKVDTFNFKADIYNMVEQHRAESSETIETLRNEIKNLQERIIKLESQLNPPSGE